MAYQYPQHQQPPYTTTAPAPNPGLHYSVADPFSQPTPYDTHGHPSTSKRRRGNLPKHVTHILKTWLNDHTRHPYPTEEEKVMLAERTGLSLNQISNWFINARRRILQPATASSAQGGGGGGAGQGGESTGGGAAGGGVLDTGGQRVFEMRKPKGDEPPLHH
ncbi:Homeodomain-like protein [Saitoella complicata NRRL Y-17804]|nr:Homeodomain-like protein [Saitoella complicata NRRL Y-17804]ODQ53732.1 Homeodomain-like protein [Saitoella complicata NRRL Y-17804]